MTGGSARLRDIGDRLRRAEKSEAQAGDRLRQIEKTVGRVHAKRFESLQASIDELHSEVREWRQQSTLQLQKLQRGEGAASKQGREGGKVGREG